MASNKVTYGVHCGHRVVVNFSNRKRLDHSCHQGSEEIIIHDTLLFTFIWTRLTVLLISLLNEAGL